jgi:hypothetical protein
MKSKPPKNLKEFIKYWDEWHNEWWVYNDKSDDIGVWPKPNKVFADKDNTGLSIDYYPEPYYFRFPSDYDGNNIDDIDLPLDAIFLSINPGGAGRIDLKSNHESILINDYVKSGRKYSFNLNNLLKHKSGPKSTNSFIEHRENRATELLFGENPSRKANVLCVDLVPWHTPNQSNIKEYILDNIPFIKKNVILPLMKIARDESIMKNILLNKIIVRGTSFRDILNEVIPSILISLRQQRVKKDIKYYAISQEKPKFIEQVSTFLTIVPLGGVKFYIFTGGQGTDIPHLNKMAYPINNNSNPATIKHLLSN